MPHTLRLVPFAAVTVLLSLVPSTLAHANASPYCSAPARQELTPVVLTGSSLSSTAHEISELNTRASALEAEQSAAPSAQLHTLLGDDYQVNFGELAKVVSFHILLETPSAKGFLFGLQADEQTLAAQSAADHQLYSAISTATLRICTH